MSKVNPLDASKARVRGLLRVDTERSLPRRDRRSVKVIILAAGKGVRMKSDLPKVLHPICGKPLIQYVVDIARAIGSLKIVVVLGHQGNEVRQILSKGVSIVRQKQLLGTADAVRTVLAQEKFSKNHDILILCGDTPLLKVETIRRLLAIHHSTKPACSVLTAHLSQPQGYGRIIRDSQGNILAIREERDASPEEKGVREINTGVYCFESQVLRSEVKKIRLNPTKKEFYLTDIVGNLVAQGLRVSTFSTQDPQEGLGINTREELSCVESIMRQRILSRHMHEGVGILDPLTTYIADQVEIGQDTLIKPFTVIESDVRIGRRCVIGPFAHLRPGVRIGNETEIGNFAEVSRSSLGAGVRMKHFSFLGDATVEDHVNIGAGVVTANYDGKSKNKTRIKEGAFVGSDSILVAPLTIGKKAVIGAGSVVPKGKDVPDGKMAVGVPARILSRRNRA